MAKRNHHTNPEAENESRRVRRWSAAVREHTVPRTPCPTHAELCNALAAARAGEEGKSRLGRMLLLLEQYEGRLVPVKDAQNGGQPWHGGLRKFLSADPILAKHYKTLMRYKAAAKMGQNKDLHQRFSRRSS